MIFFAFERKKQRFATNEDSCSIVLARAKTWEERLSIIEILLCTDEILRVPTHTPRVIKKKSVIKTLIKEKSLFFSAGSQCV